MIFSQKKPIVMIIFFLFAVSFSFPGTGYALKDAKSVAMDFNNVDIHVVIKFISELTGKNFVVDNKVKGKVTIISPTKISVENAYRVFESVLEINGFSTVTSGSIIKIVPIPIAKSDNLDTRVITKKSKTDMAQDRMVTRIIPLQYANAGELKKIFMPLMKKGNLILSYDDTNMLIITTTLSRIQRFLKIIQSIDLPGIGKKISVVPVQYADVKKLVQSLTSIFTASAKEKKKINIDKTVKFVADERTNSIIFLANEIEHQRVEKLIKILDQKVPKGEEKIRVYYLEHASAEELVKVLLEIPEKGTTRKTSGKQKSPILSANIKIMADKSTNSIIVMADKEDYPVLEQVIAKLDIPRAMVYIECLIMEVKVNSGLSVGTEWMAPKPFDNDSKAAYGRFSPGLGSIAAPYMSLLPKGLSLGVIGENIEIGGIKFPTIQAVINAFQNSTDVHILATPQILTMENEEASITVGENIPYQTRSAAEGTTDTYSSYEYKDVGITLKITPQISKDRLVKLKIFQELTKVNITSEQLAYDKPSTSKRKIETTIIVEDANTVVIGGLIDETLTRSENKTPCLGDIPILGWAFKTASDGEAKTNLYVFLTPRVIKNPMEADKIYHEKKEQIKTIQKGEVLLHEKRLKPLTKSNTDVLPAEVETKGQSKSKGQSK